MENDVYYIILYQTRLDKMPELKKWGKHKHFKGRITRAYTVITWEIMKDLKLF